MPYDLLLISVFYTLIVAIVEFINKYKKSNLLQKGVFGIDAAFGIFIVVHIIIHINKYSTFNDPDGKSIIILIFLLGFLAFAAYRIYQFFK